MKQKVILTLILFKENNFWLVQCIQYNFLSQGNSSKKAISRMFQTIEAHIHFSTLDRVKPFAEIKEALKYSRIKSKNIISIIKIVYIF